MVSDARRGYRTFWPRLWASGLDGLIVLPLGFLSRAQIGSDPDVVTYLSWNAFAGIVGFAYFTLLHARYGQTVGKKVFGVKVLHIDESRTPTLAEAFVRGFPYVVTSIAWITHASLLIVDDRYSPENLLRSGPGYTITALNWLFLLLELWVMRRSSKRRTLHDLLAGTVVVRVGSEDRSPAP